MNVPKYSTITLPALLLSGCNDEFHSLTCDGHIATSSEPTDPDCWVIGQKSMKYEYIFWGTTGLTAVPSSASGHSTVSADLKSDKHGYFSALETVISHGRP